ncbi:unnamed protein product [Clavelina lepadiformis]|uniref:TLC domain-containing protein n=1 Tax=Clavelina lepadiformis TaxID=159417 RepID=A0ABP0F3H0_CLALP
MDHIGSFMPVMRPEGESVEKITIVSVSALFFYGLSLLIQRCGCISGKVLPHKRKLWFNTLGSVIHSSIVTLCCACCFWLDPHLAFHMTSVAVSGMARFTPLMSLGYFTHDMIEMARFFKFSGAWPVIIHHVIVISIFGGIGMYTEFYNYLVMALTCEFNTIFLHIRQLFHMSGVSKDSTIYRVNSLSNISTFFVLRMMTLVWMIVCSFTSDKNDLQKRSITVWFIGVVGMILMMILNLVILYRLLTRDNLLPVQNKKKH